MHICTATLLPWLLFTKTYKSEKDLGQTKKLLCPPNKLLVLTDESKTCSLATDLLQHQSMSGTKGCLTCTDCPAKPHVCIWQQLKLSSFTPAFSLQVLLSSHTEATDKPPANLKERKTKVTTALGYKRKAVLWGVTKLCILLSSTSFLDKLLKKGRLKQLPSAQLGVTQGKRGSPVRQDSVSFSSHSAEVPPSGEAAVPPILKGLC